ncbi:patatin-like phospholipase family protein [Candidatus Neomarinimicrobiota bacterium]
MMQVPKVGLALGAGGARGLSHVGVIRALIRGGIPIDYITGSSIGAVVGAMYAGSMDIDWVEHRLTEMLTSEPFAQSGIDKVQVSDPDSDPGFLQWAAHRVRQKLILNFSDMRPGLVNNRRLLKLIDYLLPVKTFEELKMTFGCEATDLKSGNNICLSSGNLVEAVAASASIPGYITPMDSGSYQLVDGGVGQPIPFDAAVELGAEFIIAVDVSIDSYVPSMEQNILGVLARTNEIATTKLAEAQSKLCDFTIHPDTMNLHWTQFDRIAELIASGEKAGNIAMEPLGERLFAPRGVKPWFSRILSFLGRKR